MGHHVCPPWVGYILLNPLRKLLENPNKLLGGLVSEGMTVLEPGCGMGFFTLPLARMVGPRGRVVAVEVEPRMLYVLRRRAEKAGLADRIELRQIQPQTLGIDDLSGAVDFTAAIHVVHEVPNPRSFFAEVWNALKPHGRLLIVEPKHHVSQDEFNETVALAERTGFQSESGLSGLGAHRRLFTKRGI